MDDVVYSVIVPAYKPKAELIQRALLSVLKADMKNQTEIIVIADKVDKDAAKVFENLEGPRVHILNIPNVSVSCSRNLGLNEAKGEYALFLDADDYVEKDLFLKLDEVISEKPDLIFFGFNKWINGKKIEILPPEKNNAIEMAASDNNGTCWNKAYRLKFLKEKNIRFRDELVLAEDIEFVLRTAANAETFKILPICLYDYVVYQTSVSQRFRKDMQDEYLKSMKIISSQKEIDLSLADRIILNHLIFTILKHSFHPQKKNKSAEFYKLINASPYKEALQRGQFSSFSKTKQIILKSAKDGEILPLKAAAFLYRHR